MIRYKKIVSIAMSMLVMATAFSTNVFASCCIEPYTINGDTLTLKKGGKAKLKDKISNNDINNIRQANVDPGITSIGGTFEGFTELRKVEFTDADIDNSKLEEIGDNAFKNCTNLRSITIPGSVRTIGKEAFSGCENLETVTIEQIDERRNRFARNFAPDVFPPAPEEQSIEIKDNAFLSCKKLERVIIISNNVASIGKNAFMDCKSLKSITNSPNDNRDIITIPNSVTSIGSNAFSGCNSLTSVDITQSSINKISEGTFQGCTKLMSITISDSVTSIGEWAFRDCRNLETINIPNSVENIDTDAFRDCKNLRSIKIGNKIIGKFKDIFGGLKIENVTISDDIQEINDETFTGYTSLKHVTIPSSVKTIGNRAFMGCSNLESVNSLGDVRVQNGDNNNEFKIGQMAFMGCINLQRICIPETIRNIDQYAFLGCTSLISRDNDELRIPNSVTDIGEYAFMGCLSLNKLTIPDRTTNIHNYALMGCINLNTLSMPRNVILGHHAIIGDFIENIIYRDIV